MHFPSGKRRVPAVISTAPSRRDEKERARRRLVIAVAIKDSEGKVRIERALIDSGAEENCVRQTLVLDCGWEPTGEESSGLATLDGKEVWTYGIHDLPISATDSGGELRTSQHAFVACDFEGLDVNLILGYPWLEAVDPLLGFRAGIWRYAKSTVGVEVLGPEEFYEETEGAKVYCVLARARLGSLRIGVVSALAAEAATNDGIPKEY